MILANSSIAQPNGLANSMTKPVRLMVQRCNSSASLQTRSLNTRISSMMKLPNCGVCAMMKVHSAWTSLMNSAIPTSVMREPIQSTAMGLEMAHLRQ